MDESKSTIDEYNEANEPNLSFLNGASAGAVLGGMVGSRYGGILGSIIESVGGAVLGGLATFNPPE